MILNYVAQPPEFPKARRFARPGMKVLSAVFLA